MNKIVIFSDLHYAPEKPMFNDVHIGRKLIEYSLPLIDKLIDRVNNEIKPDLVLNLGDLIEDFNNHDVDVVNLKYIWNRLKTINCKFYSCIGNHDLRSMSSREEVEEIMEYDNASFSFDMLGLHIVILGSDEVCNKQCVTEKDLIWLEKDLANNKLPTIICLHFGVADDDMKGNWWFENDIDDAMLGNKEELKNIIKKCDNVLAVFSGHQHWTKVIEEDGILYYVLGSLTEGINDDGVPDGVYFIVEYDGKDLKVIEEHIRL